VPKPLLLAGILNRDISPEAGLCGGPGVCQFAQHVDRALREASVFPVALEHLNDTLDPSRSNDGVLIFVVVMHEVAKRAEHGLGDSGVSAEAVEGRKEPRDSTSAVLTRMSAASGEALIAHSTPHAGASTACSLACFSIDARVASRTPASKALRAFSSACLSGTCGTWKTFAALGPAILASTAVNAAATTAGCSSGRSFHFNFRRF
jgi:hypothetical protein